MAHQVLISYSSEDKLQADAICNRLESQGIRCWIAPRDVQGGTEYADSIVQAIEAAEVMVLVYSKSADESKQVRREVERAVSEGTKIMPVRIEEAEMSKSFEYYVGSIHWLDAITPPFEEHIDRLAKDLKALLDVETSGGKDAPADGATPPSPPDTPPTPDPTPAPTPAPPVVVDGAPPKKRTALFGGAAALVAVLAAAAIYYFNASIVVQNVAGQSEFAALEILQDQGFEVVTELASSEDRASGVAIETDPQAGDKARRGNQVRLFVSGMVTFPQVVGSTEADARAALGRLSVGDHTFSLDDQLTVSTEPGGQTAGQVLQSTPAAGQTFLLTGPVTLTVSGEKVSVPNVVAQSAAEAQQAIESALLGAVIVQDWEAGATVGSVLRTEPAAGAEADRGSEVSLYVAGSGGWVYANIPGLQVGQVFSMPQGLNMRAAANSGARALGVAARGAEVRVLAPPTGDGWVKIVIN